MGSRDVSPEGAEVATDAARHAVEHEHDVISGASPGVDRVAMEAALEADGRCAGLLADSLLRVTREPEYRVAIGQGRLCLATPYPPSAGYSVANARGRNKLIFAASDTTLVVAANHDEDTTHAGAAEALEHGYGDVAVWTGPGAGPSNQELVELGGRPITDLDQLWDDPDQPTPSRPRRSSTSASDASTSRPTGSLRPGPRRGRRGGGGRSAPGTPRACAELLRGAPVVGVRVQRAAPVGRPDLLRAGVGRDAQERVERRIHPGLSPCPSQQLSSRLIPAARSVGRPAPGLTDHPDSVPKCMGSR